MINPLAVDPPAVPPRGDQPRDAVGERAAGRGDQIARADRDRRSRSSSSASSCSTESRRTWPRICSSARIAVLLRYGQVDARSRAAGDLVEESLERVDPPRPTVVGGGLDPGARRAARAAAGSPSSRAIASATERRSAAGIRQFCSVEAEVAVAVGVGADDRAARWPSPRARGRQKPSCAGGLHEHRRLGEQRVDLGVGRRGDVAHARVPSASSGSIPNRHSSGRGSGSARQAASVSGRFFSGFERPSARTMSARRSTSGQRAEVVEVDAGRDQRRIEPELARAGRGSTTRSSCSGTRGGRRRAPRARTYGRRRVVARLDVLDEVDRDAREHAGPPDRRGRVPPGRDLDRLERRERLAPARRSRSNGAPARGARTSPARRRGVHSSTSCPRSSRPLRCSKTSRCPPPTPVSSVT